MDKNLMDMHSHSTWSDGEMTPFEIYEMVKDKGMSVFSITDHDSIMGTKLISDMNIKDITFIKPLQNFFLEIDKNYILKAINILLSKVLFCFFLLFILLF